MIPPAGLEPATSRLEVGRAIHCAKGAECVDFLVCSDAHPLRLSGGSSAGIDPATFRL